MQSAMTGRDVDDSLGILYKYITDRHGQVVNTPASCSMSQVQFPAPVTVYPVFGFSWFYSVPTGECWGITLKLGPDHFLPNPF
jgi:hypothetical protein